MANQTSYQSGVDAETLAQKHLKQQGFEIAELRYKTPYGEIDLIATNAESVIFVEVKKRKSFNFDSPVSKTQKNRITNAALQYISENQKINELEMRFDCIFIDSTNSLTHINNAWSCEEL